MDEDVIDALADAFGDVYNELNGERLDINLKAFAEMVLNKVIYKVAEIINSEEPTYDLRYYYRRANFPKPYPVHELR